MASVRPDPSWSTLHRAGAVSSLVFVVLVLVPVILVFTAPLPPNEGRAVLEYIASNKVVYLVELVSFVGLAVPALVVFAALAVALRDVDRSLAALGGLFGVASETIALALGSSPESLHGGLVVLSDSYVGADEAGRASLAIAAQSLIAATNAVSWAGILTAVAIGLLSWAMRRADFGRVVVVLGVLTGVLGVLAEALRPFIGGVYAIYGLLLPVWFGMVGWRLWKLSRIPVSVTA